MSWSTAPTELAPRYGPAWDVDVAEAVPVGRGGWVTTLERAMVLRSSGTLAVTLKPGYARTGASFSASGELSETLAPHYALAFAFTSAGRLIVSVIRAVSIVTGFGAEGSLALAFNDGLYISVGPNVAVPMAFSATGGLTIGSGDGLVITWGPGDAPAAIVTRFDAAGALVIGTAPGFSVPVAFAAIGVLVMDTVPGIPEPVAFAATGALSIGFMPNIPVTPIDGLAMAVFGKMP